jgi:hypothetical protein
MIILETLSKLDNITLEELDLTVWFESIGFRRKNLYCFFFLGFNNESKSNIES